MSTILEKLNLQDRMEICSADCLWEKINASIDWDQVAERLDWERQESLDFLRKALAQNGEG